MGVVIITTLSLLDTGGGSGGSGVASLDAESRGQFSFSLFHLFLRSPAFQGSLALSRRMMGRALLRLPLRTPPHQKLPHARMTQRFVSSDSKPPGKHDDSKSAVVAGAAAIGGVAATFVAGPLVGLVAAGGAAYVAATRDDKAGDAAKAVGRAAISAARKAASMDREHELSRKVGDATKGAMDTARELNAKHKITSKMFDGISSAANTVSKALDAGEEKKLPPRGR